MKKHKIISAIKEMLNKPSFKEDHRISPTCFIRNRKLTFIVTFLVIVRKSIKSLQLTLNELFYNVDSQVLTATNSAFTQARSKFLHTAFIELNQKAIVEPFYQCGNFKTFWGFRLLAVDGSKIILPQENEITNFFGSIKIANQVETTDGEYPAALASVFYDVLNGIALDSILGPAKAYEVDLAIQHLSNYTKGNDLNLFDRNYPSYLYLAKLIQDGINFAGRCSRSSFKEAREMFENNIHDQVVTLRPHHTKKQEIKELGLPNEIKVRFVKVILDTGEIEILVTSLLDQTLYKTSDFKELYHLRWGVETFYGIIKGRLNLENFTGKNVEAVRQDFYSTIFISSLESVLIQDAQSELDQKTSNNQYAQKVNKNVSFNAIKTYAIDLILKEQDTTLILEKLTQLFKTNPVCVRNHRKIPRQKRHSRIVLNFWKRCKKICF